MKPILASLAILASAAVHTSHGQPWAEKMFDERSHDFGSVARDAKAEHRFKITNFYMEDVHIAGVDSSCGCATPRIEKPLLATYEEGAVVVRLNTERLRGHQSSTITVTLDKPRRARVQLHVKAYIYDAVLFDPPAVELGSVEQGEEVERTVSVTYTRGSQWRILEARSATPHLSAEVVERRREAGKVTYEVRARLDQGAPVGYVRDHLMLVTNDPRAREIPLAVEGQVVGSLTASPSSLFLGVLKPGNSVRKQLVVRAKEPFVIQAIEADCDCFAFDIPQPREAKPFYLVPMTFTAGQKPGRVGKTLRIETDRPSVRAEVAAFGVVAE